MHAADRGQALDVRDPALERAAAQQRGGASLGHRGGRGHRRAITGERQRIRHRVMKFVIARPPASNRDLV